MKKIPAGTINLCPTWSNLLPTLLELYRSNCTLEATQAAYEELQRMARVADLYVKEHKDDEDKKD